jgi:hypothetical protein
MAGLKGNLKKNIKLFKEWKFIVEDIRAAHVAIFSFFLRGGGDPIQFVV